MNDLNEAILFKNGGLNLHRDRSPNLNLQSLPNKYTCSHSQVSGRAAPVRVRCVPFPLAPLKTTQKADLQTSAALSFDLQRLPPVGARGRLGRECGGSSGYTLSCVRRQDKDERKQSCLCLLESAAYA